MFEARGIDANFDERSMCTTRLKIKFPCECVVVDEAVLKLLPASLLPIGFHAEAGRVVVTTTEPQPNMQ